MEQVPPNAARTPTKAWAGLNLSKTSPFALEKANIPQWTNRDEAFSFKLSSSTGVFDNIPAQDRIKLSQFQDIYSLLTHLKLGHYISKSIIFHRQHYIHICIVCLKSRQFRC